MNAPYPVGMHPRIGTAKLIAPDVALVKLSTRNRGSVPLGTVARFRAALAFKAAGEDGIKAVDFKAQIVAQAENAEWMLYRITR